MIIGDIKAVINELEALPKETHFDRVGEHTIKIFNFQGSTYYKNRSTRIPTNMKFLFSEYSFDELKHFYNGSIQQTLEILHNAISHYGNNLEIVFIHGTLAIYKR